jgi:hypothetical protein
MQYILRILHTPCRVRHVWEGAQALAGQLATSATTNARLYFDIQVPPDTARIVEKLTVQLQAASQQLAADLNNENEATKIDEDVRTAPAARRHCLARDSQWQPCSLLQAAQCCKATGIVNTWCC